LAHQKKCREAISTYLLTILKKWPTGRTGPERYGLRARAEAIVIIPQTEDKNKKGGVYGARKEIESSYTAGVVLLNFVHLP